MTLLFSWELRGVDYVLQGYATELSELKINCNRVIPVGKCFPDCLIFAFILLYIVRISTGVSKTCKLIYK